MAMRVTLECGHTSELRAQRTPEGYTHDWQVFVRGVDNAEIHQYIEKVVFQLHETFPKPKRVLREPPYVVKESGYAGFEIPISVYLKNKDEPKKFHISYDLNLQPSGPAINKVLLHSENISNPNDEFRKKLLKGGAVMVTNSEGTPEKSKATPLMVGKPKLSGTEGKKYRMSEPKGSNAFADLFGPPIKTAGTKVSPDTKKPSSSSTSSSSTSDKTSSTKLSSSEKPEKSDKSSKAKHSPHKDGKKEKSSDERKEKKDKESSKEKEKNKEKSKKSQSPTNKSSHNTSPGTKRPASPSPIKKPSTPPPSQPSKRPPSPKPREKESKKVPQEKDKEKEKEKIKETSKNTSDDSRTEKKKDKKKHKEDKEKEKKDKHKDRERDKSKDSKESKTVEKKIEKPEKPEKIDKEKPQEFKQSKDGRKSPKPIKEIEKVPKEEKPPKLEKIEKTEKLEKSKDNKEKEKHKSKHKKREKKDKRDGSKERDKKEKRDKNRSSSEKSNNAPIQAPVTTNPLSTLLAEMPDRDSSDSAPSLDDEPIITEPKIIPPVKKEPPVLTPTVSNESKPIMSPPPVSDKKNRSDRTKRDKSKGNREDKETKKRKRRSESKGDDERVIKKERDQSASPLVEPVSSSQSPIAVDMETVHQKVPKEDGAASRKQSSTGKGSEGEGEQVAPDSTNSTLVEPETTADTSSFSQEYVSQLKDLQHKIMTIEDNQELQRLVEVIAETGQYEVTKKTFDFDLCALDRRTVQRLQQFFAS